MLYFGSNGASALGQIKISGNFVSVVVVVVGGGVGVGVGGVGVGVGVALGVGVGVGGRVRVEGSGLTGLLENRYSGPPKPKTYKT